MIHRTPSLLPILYPTLLWRMPADKRELYLTFDDGPVPDVTEFVLAELRKHYITATFFCIGDNVAKYPAIFQKVVNEGHAIGNHTFNHLNGWRTETYQYLNNIERCDSIILDNCQFSSINYYRPPYGRITRSQIRNLSLKRIVMWDVLTRDYDSSLNEEKCLKNSLNAIRNGSIVVFHDSVKAQRNLTYVLPRFIKDCLERGYTFKLLV